MVYICAHTLIVSAYESESPRAFTSADTRDEIVTELVVHNIFFFLLFWGLVVQEIDHIFHGLSSRVERKTR